MKILFTMDEKNYTEEMPVFERYGVRAIIQKDGLFAMQKSKDGEYKIPGGGVEKGETLLEALKREVQEETGLLVEDSSVCEIGEVLELREDCFTKGVKYIAHSIFYRCEVLEETTEPKLTESEKLRGYGLVWATPEEIITTNEKIHDGQFWRQRDTEFIKWYTNGGY